VPGRTYKEESHGTEKTSISNLWQTVLLDTTNLQRERDMHGQNKLTVDRSSLHTNMLAGNRGRQKTTLIIQYDVEYSVLCRGQKGGLLTLESKGPARFILERVKGEERFQKNDIRRTENLQKNA